MTISQRIKLKRKEFSITQEQLANSTELSIDTIKKLETDRVMPSIETLEKLCRIFQCTADYLLGWDSPKESINIEELPLSPYAKMLKSALNKSELSMTEIANRLSINGRNIHASYIGKLASDKREPASDEVNRSLAEFLQMDELEFRTLAWLEKIPTDVLNKLKEDKQ